LENLRGTPMPQDASFDELRLKDVPAGTTLKPSSVIDPLACYAGRTQVRFTDTGGPPRLVDLSAMIDHAGQTVVSSTHQLKLDYGKGTLIINAPAAQGVSGNLKSIGTVQTADVSIRSGMDLGQVIAIALDGKPLASSGRILLQVMSEERTSGYRTADAGNGKRRITDIGHDPWLVKELNGTVNFKCPDAGRLKVMPLDFDGYPTKRIAGSAKEIQLDARTIYYLIEK